MTLIETLYSITDTLRHNPNRIHQDEVVKRLNVICELEFLRGQNQPRLRAATQEERKQ